MVLRGANITRNMNFINRAINVDNLDLLTTKKQIPRGSLAIVSSVL